MFTSNTGPRLQKFNRSSSIKGKKTIFYNPIIALKEGLRKE